MLKIRLILCFLLCGVLGLRNPPRKPHYPNRNKEYKSHVVRDMNFYLVKDATIKLWHADRVQQRYMGSLSYELGVITAGIQDIFKKMVTTYRKYSNLTNYRFHQYYMEEILAAYHIVKGDFNALRMEKNMFNEVLNTHRDRARIAKTTRKRMYAGRPGTRSRGEVPYEEKERILRRRLKYEKWTETAQIDQMDLDDLLSDDEH